MNFEDSGSVPDGTIVRAQYTEPDSKAVVDLEIELVSGRRRVKKAVLATQSLKVRNPEMNINSLMGVFLGRHSPMRNMEFDIYAIGISDRVHTHMVRHDDMAHFLGTQRSDIPTPDKVASMIGGKTRFYMGSVSAAKLVEVFFRRACSGAWVDIREMMTNIRNIIGGLEPQLPQFLVAPCVWHGFCTEPMHCVRTSCEFMGSKEWRSQRSRLKEISRKLLSDEKTKPAIVTRIVELADELANLPRTPITEVNE